MVAERPVSVVRFSGSGRHKFLHGLCTQAVESIERGSGVVDASVVDAKGRLLTLLTLVDTKQGTILAIGPAGRGEDTAAFFDKYCFPADDVAVDDVTSMYSECMELVGPGAEDCLAQTLGADSTVLPRPGQYCEVAMPPILPAPADESSVLVLGSSSLGFDGRSGNVYSVLFPAAGDKFKPLLTEAARKSGGCLVDWDAVRILRGRPRNGFEFAAKGSALAAEARAGSGEGAVPRATPFELGLWSSVHLDKGCYMGQEVLTRLARVKKPRRALYGIRFEDAVGGGPRVEEGAEVTLLQPPDEGADDGGHAAVGILTSILQEGEQPTFGLALVNPSAATVGARVDVCGALGTVVELACATRAGAQAGGGANEGEDDREDGTDDASDAAAKKAQAEAERKAAKLEAMAAKLKALGLQK